MKIAILTRYNTYCGGVESVNTWLSHLLHEAGHDVTIIGNDDIPSYLLNPLRRKYYGEPTIYARHIAPQLQQYDCIICNGEFGFGIDHPHCVNLFHGSAYGYRKGLQGYLSIMDMLRLMRISHWQRKGSKKKYVVAVSDHLKTVLEDQGIAVDAVIENCVDTQRFFPYTIPRRKQCLFVANYDYYGKGFDIIHNIARCGIDIDCMTSQSLCNVLHHIPQVPYEQMPQVCSQYRFLIFPSRYEGLGLAPLEAMACGLPVVISVPGLGHTLRNFIPEFVVDGYNPDEYVNRIRLIECNYDAYSQKAVQYIHRHHSFDTFRKKWLQVIRMHSCV